MGSSDEAAEKSGSSSRGEGPHRTPGKKTDRPSQRPGGPATLIGTVLSGRYRIEKVIGEGGMGAVYQAEHTHMRKRLAVKVLHPEMSRLPEVVARFEREAMAAAHIDHPNVAAATDFGKLDDGSFFLVLEFVEGSGLRETVGKGRLALGRALNIMRQIASALQRANALGIVHRDLKPENVMLVEREGDADFVKVLDFGIAKVPVGGLGTGNAAPGQPVLTQLGMVYGTPEYMAPEQALGQSVDARADLYALGIIGYEMMTGFRPFDHESKVTLLGMQVTAPVPPMATKAPDAQIPPEVEAIVLKCLAKEASQRYADAKELYDAITGVSGLLLAQGRITSLPLSVPLGGASSSGAYPQQGPPSSPQIIPGPMSMPHPSLAGQPVLRSDVPAISAARSSRAPAPNKRLVIAGIATGALVLVGIVTALIVSAARSPAAEAGSTSATARTTVADGREVPTEAISAEPSAKPQPPLAPAVEAVRDQAKGDIEKGNFANAIELLAPIGEKNKDRADVHQLLERAYVGAKQTKEAMKEALLFVKADESAITDLKLDEDIRNAALGKDGADEAFALLETHMKTTGVDILWDIAYGNSGKQYPQAAYRAMRSLTKPEVKALASPQLALALDLRDYGKSCGQKHAMLARAKEEADWRALPPLKLLTATSGCGFLHRKDCWGCMRADHALTEAITAIEARSQQPKTHD